MEDASNHSFTQIADEIDRLFQAGLSRITCGLTPAGMTEVYVSWLAHLALCPGRMAATDRAAAPHPINFMALLENQPVMSVHIIGGLSGNRRSAPKP